jgi:phenylpropionate dioxygenase-like ring-hydroxylating dioxygenase large terminal subunit
MQSVYLRNAWYLAAWANELKPGEPFARTLLDEPVMMYRTGDGTPVALEDRCCHRSLPLSLGKIEGDRIRCGYHGLLFDAAGKCVQVPGQSLVPPGSGVRRYPAVERWRAIWLWMGEAAAADPALIPNLYWLDHPQWGAGTGQMQIKCGYQLIVDNVLDLTHLSYVHPRTFGTLAIAESPARYERVGDQVRITRWILDSKPPGVMARNRAMDGNIDRRQLITFLPPSVVTIEGWFGPTVPNRDERAEPEGGFGICNINALTPVSATETLHLFAEAQSYAPRDDAATDKLFREVYDTFLEDIEVLQAQQRALLERPNRPMIDINADAGGLEARRIMARLTAADTQRTAA